MSRLPDKVHKPEVAQGQKSKTCSACGRTMEWRKSWARNWDNVKYCSDKCRSGNPAVQDRDLEETILRLLAERGAGKTICPSEAARAVAVRSSLAATARESWEPLMEPARAAARRLVAKGRLVIVQAGQIVDGSTAKGPIRLRLR